MRLLHTSDWHIGHTLCGHDRGPEHDAFFEWLLNQLHDHAVDVLLVTGDLFDTSNPSAASQERLYRLLARARARCPKLQMVLTGGNHDSAARLDAPDPLLRELGITVIGGLPRQDGAPDLDRLIVPLRDARGRTAGWCGAVPYVRPHELPPAPGWEDPVVGGLHTLYASVVDAMRARRTADQPMVLLGHLSVVGARLSESSERRVHGGQDHAPPPGLFASDVAYTALGHLHFAQHVGRATIRYAGSPIPLGIAERRYAHEVVLIDLFGDTPATITSLRVPRSVEILRIPDQGAAPLHEVLDAIRALPTSPPATSERRPLPAAVAEMPLFAAATAPPPPPQAMTSPPFLEVSVLLPAPEPALRRRIDDALRGRWVRLARISTTTTGSDLALGDTVVTAVLDDLSLRDVVLARWKKDHEGEPDDAFWAALDEVEASVRAEEGA